MRMPVATVKEKASGAFIRSVNPRLVGYSKPLLLAGLVMIGTLALTGALFAVQMVQCPKEVAVQLDTFFGSMDEQKDTYRRKMELAGTQAGTTTTVTICLKTSNELAVVGHPNYVDTLTSPGVVQYNPCSLDSSAMAELRVRLLQHAHHRIAPALILYRRAWPDANHVGPVCRALPSPQRG